MESNLTDVARTSPLAPARRFTMETYYGTVRCPADAIKLFEACRLGLLPRVQRRLSEKERQSIKSGSVFVWDEREAGMRRWTDGKSWSASRVSGSFLTYREMEGKRGGGSGLSKRQSARSPNSDRISDDDRDGEPECYRYKTDGLTKQSFSITTSQGQRLHLISYSARTPNGSQEPPQPTSDPALRTVTPVKGLYPESSFQDYSAPAMTQTPMLVYPPAMNHEVSPPHSSWYSPPRWPNLLPPSPKQTPPPAHWRGQDYGPSLPSDQLSLQPIVYHGGPQSTVPLGSYPPKPRAAPPIPPTKASIPVPVGTPPVRAPRGLPVSYDVSLRPGPSRGVSLSTMLIHDVGSQGTNSGSTGSSSPEAAAAAQEMSAKALRKLDRKFGV
ncbi:Gti1/Pac2 family-domain-containing protein [Xylaria nigripes]|nr:Gti1/Pac2 family-domain-containing protein [Xylaria nigripes]